MAWNICRLCKHHNIANPVLRYSIRHYCRADCGFNRWGLEFLRKIPAYEIGAIPWRLLCDPDRRKLALELCPDNIKAALATLTVEETME